MVADKRLSRASNKKREALKLGRELAEVSKRSIQDE
jgi:hypothetical protein